MLVLTGRIEAFVERDGVELVLSQAEAGAVLGELAVLCGIPRSASLRASEHAAVLQWSAASFRNILLRYALLSERIFRQSLRVLVDKERSLIESLTESRGPRKETDQSHF